MAGAKRRKRAKQGPDKRIAWGGPATAGANRLNLLLAALVAVALAAGGWYLWRDSAAEEAFLALAEEGQPALARVETMPDHGREHLEPNRTHRYEAEFPTSGIHEPAWIDPGFYREAQPPTRLVHSLEHGHIVIYYDEPGAATLDLIETWTELYGAEWQGVVATPRAGLGEATVLTAWPKKLHLEPFEPAAAAAFIDAFRGRGPENPVR